MKLTIPAFFAMLLLLSSCDKLRKKTAPPTVRIDAVERQPDGTVKISATLTSEEDASISSSTFCMDTVSTPDTATNRQAATDFNINSFSFVYPLASFKEGKTYYFKAVASNRYGTAISEVKSIDYPGLDTSTIPCHPQMNHFLAQPGNIDHSFVVVDPLANNFFGWHLEARANYLITIKFGVYPHSGVYNITGEFDNPESDNEVSVVIDGDIVNAGQVLYVQRIDEKTMDITMCGLTSMLHVGWGTPTQHTISAKFRSKG